MPMLKGVISTLTSDGQEVMGPDVLLYHYPDNSIVNGSLLTVDTNHFCVLKSRGAILNVYETGQYTVQTPDHPLIGSVIAAFMVAAHGSTKRFTSIVPSSSSKRKVLHCRVRWQRCPMMLTITYM